MTQKTRRQVLLDAHDLDRLKVMSIKLGMSESELLRVAWQMSASEGFFPIAKSKKTRDFSCGRCS